MSFLDVLDSIGTGQHPSLSTSSSAPYAPSHPTKPQSNAPLTRQPHNGVPPPPTKTKRQGDEALERSSDKLLHPPANQGSRATLSKIPERKTPVKPSSLEKLPARVASPASSTSATRVPPKGSYAALMAEAKAKAAEQQRMKSEVGQIKHQATSKLKLSKTEKRRQEEADKALRAKLGKRPQHNSKVEKAAARLAAKKRLESSYKGTAKPAAVISAYKGTAGLPSLHRASSVDARHKASQKPRSYDEYLGTDEEDEVDGIDVGGMGDGYGTEASSDMEAGAFDVAEEEWKALQVAKEDDAREFELEKKRKLEKERRKRKLEALAKKRR